MKTQKKSLIMAIMLAIAALLLFIPGHGMADDDRGRNEERHEKGRTRDDEHEEKAEDHSAVERNASKNSAPFPQNAVYKQECSSCHFLYHPGLLPLKSWETIIKGSDKHFGEKLSLEDKTKDDLLAYFYEHSAEKTDAKWARRALTSTGSSVHVRITELPFIIREHRKIQKSVFKRPSINSFSNCGACHPKGSEGDFDEDRVEIPAK